MFSKSLLKFSLCLFILLSLVSIFVTTTLNCLTGQSIYLWFIRFFFVFFFNPPLGFCLAVWFGAYSSVFSFCFAFCVCFYELGELVTFSSLKVMALCKSIPFIDCVCWLALIGLTLAGKEGRLWDMVNGGCFGRDILGRLW